VRRRDYLAVACAALSVRLAYVLWLPESRADRVTPDSGHYLDVVASPLWGLPERMPLYPAYLWLVSALTGSADELWPILGQCALDTATCLVVAAIVREFHPRAGLPAGLAAAFNPVQIVYAGFILTDTLFLFFATLALWRLVVWSRDFDPAEAWRAGAFLALALLVRVHIWPFAVLLPAYALTAGVFRARLGLAARAAAILALAAALPLAGTAAVNRASFGQFALTTQSGEHVLYWIVPLVRDAWNGAGYAEERERLYAIYSERHPGTEAIDPFRAARAQREIAREELAGVPAAAYIRAWAAGMTVNLFAPAIAQVPAVARLPRASWYATEGDGLAARLANYFAAAEGGTFAWFLAGGLAIEAGLRALALIGLATALAGRRLPWGLVLLAAWAAFTLLIAGPVVAPKYRLPAEPVFCALIGVALARYFTSSSARASPATSR
jgi:4-amino-4-deoxy-L-arabinose transferase-like glycosyltransferase